MLFRSPDGEVVKVKVGFSWQAFFVGSLRAVLKRTWLLLGLGVFVYLVVAWMGPSYITASSRNVALLLALLALYLVYMMFCGLYGNRWLVRSLLRRGFRKIGDEKG